MLKLTFSLTFSVCLLLIAVGLSKSSATPTMSTPVPVLLEPTIPNDKIEVIDGAVTPDKISDHDAYIILFRFIARRETDEEKNRIKSYLSQALGCNRCEGPNASEQADVETLIAAAAEFDQQATILDMQAGVVLERYHPDHRPMTSEDKTFLTQLQRQKEELAKSIAASLKSRLSSEGWKNLNKHIKERMKKKMKIFKSKKTG